MVNVQKEFVEKLFSIEGKVALVTGATGALGSAVAVGYALAGAKVVLTGRNAAKLDEVAKQIKEEGGECACVAADPAVEEDVKKAVKFTVDTYGELNHSGCMPRLQQACKHSGTVRRGLEEDYGCRLHQRLPACQICCRADERTG